MIRPALVACQTQTGPAKVRLLEALQRVGKVAGSCPDCRQLLRNSLEGDQKQTSATNNGNLEGPRLLVGLLTNGTKAVDMECNTLVLPLLVACLQQAQLRGYGSWHAVCFLCQAFCWFRQDPSGPAQQQRWCAYFRRYRYWRRPEHTSRTCSSIRRCTTLVTGSLLLLVVSPSHHLWYSTRPIQQAERSRTDPNDFAQGGDMIFTVDYPIHTSTRLYHERHKLRWSWSAYHSARLGATGHHGVDEE